MCNIQQTRGTDRPLALQEEQSDAQITLWDTGDLEHRQQLMDRQMADRLQSQPRSLLEVVHNLAISSYHRAPHGISLASRWACRRVSHSASVPQLPCRAPAVFGIYKQRNFIVNKSQVMKLIYCYDI